MCLSRFLNYEGPGRLYLQHFDKDLELGLQRYTIVQFYPPDFPSGFVGRHEHEC